MAEAAVESINCSYTDEIVCPHCGYEFSDSWEIRGDIGECHECEKRFCIERETGPTMYSTSPEPPPREKVLAKERARLGPPDLSFRDGVPAADPREGEITIYETTVGIWEEHVHESMSRVMRGVLAVLHQAGFVLGRDTDTLENYPSLADSQWHGVRRGLEVGVSLSGRHLEIQFFQNINIENQNGGRYDFKKLDRMSQRMKLECLTTMTKVVRRGLLHGYALADKHHLKSVAEEYGAERLTLAVRDAATGAAQRTADPLTHFNRRWSWHRFERDEMGFPTPKEYRHWRSTDHDGVQLRPGDTRYFYQDGHLVRANVYPDANGQWMVLAGGVIGFCSPMEMFSDPTGRPRRFVRAQGTRLIAELVKETQAQNFKRVERLAHALVRLGSAPAPAKEPTG